MARGRKGVGEEVEQQVAEMFRGGMGIDAIMNELLIARSTVYTVLRRKGLKAQADRPSIVDRYSEAELEAFRKDYDAGVALTDLAARYQLHNASAIYNLMYEMGIIPRTKTAKYLQGRQLMFDHAVKLYEEGWALWYIHQETGINPMSLNKELHKRGVVLRRDRGVMGYSPPTLKDGAPRRYVPGLEKPTPHEPEVGEPSAIPREPHG